MSDPIAEAAASLSDGAPSSTEPAVVQAAVEQPVPAVIEPAIAPVTGNVLVNAGPVVDSPNVAGAADGGAQTSTAGAAPVGGGDALPRESHLMLLEAKIGIFRAKLANAERVALDEFESIVGHVKAVL